MTSPPTDPRRVADKPEHGEIRMETTPDYAAGVYRVKATLYFDKARVYVRAALQERRE